MDNLDDKGNLTVKLRVVAGEMAGIRLLPGWHTILLKQERGGRKCIQHLQPGQQPERGMIERWLGDSAYTSVPVTNDRNLRHQFRTAVGHVLPGHAFEALYI